MRCERLHVALSDQTRLAAQVIRARATPPCSPVVVFLHHGLGDSTAWGPLPELLAARGGVVSFPYDRSGYGQSTPVVGGGDFPTDLVTREAEYLSTVISLAGLRDAPLFLVGHGDGSSIALAYAAGGSAIRGLVTVAPRVVPEQRLLDAAAAMEGQSHWGRLWSRDISDFFDLRPSLGEIRCPVLIIQGANDEYGTVECQIDPIQNSARGAVDVVMVPGRAHKDVLFQAKKSRRGKLAKNVLDPILFERILDFISSNSPSPAHD